MLAVAVTRGGCTKQSDKPCIAGAATTTTLGVERFVCDEHFLGVAFPNI